MRKTNQPEQNGKYWQDFESILDYATETDRNTQLMVDHQGQFHLVDIQDFIDGEAVPEDDDCSAKVFFDNRGMAYDGSRVEQRILDRLLTAPEAARLFVKFVVPKELKPFVSVR